MKPSFGGASGASRHEAWGNEGAIWHGRRRINKNEGFIWGGPRSINFKKWVVGAGHEAKIIQKEKGAQIETPGHGQSEIETPGKSPKSIARKSLRGSGAPNLDKAR